MHTPESQFKHVFPDCSGFLPCGHRLRLGQHPSNDPWAHDPIIHRGIH